MIIIIPGHKYIVDGPLLPPSAAPKFESRKFGMPAFLTDFTTARIFLFLLDTEQIDELRVHKVSYRLLIWVFVEVASYENRDIGEERCIEVQENRNLFYPGRTAFLFRF